MSPAEQLRDDLSYVAGTVRRAERNGGVAAVYFLWAILVPIGFALPDFLPAWAGAYWLVAGPLGGIASFVLGARESRRRGEDDRRIGLAYAWHWTFSGVAFVAVFFPVLAGTLTVGQAVPYMLLAVALAYGLAGTLLEPPLRGVGAVMLAGFTVLTLVKLPFAWTLTGLLVGAALVYAGLGARR